MAAEKTLDDIQQLIPNRAVIFTAVGEGAAHDTVLFCLFDKIYRDWSLSASDARLLSWPLLAQLGKKK